MPSQPCTLSFTVVPRSHLSACCPASVWLAIICTPAAFAPSVAGSAPLTLSSPQNAHPPVIVSAMHRCIKHKHLEARMMALEQPWPRTCRQRSATPVQACAGAHQRPKRFVPQLLDSMSVTRPCSVPAYAWRKFVPGARWWDNRTHPTVVRQYRNHLTGHIQRTG